MANTVNPPDAARNMNSIYGMIRAQKLARKIKARAVFLVAEKKKIENTGKISISHLDIPQSDLSVLGSTTMQNTLPIPRYLNSSSRSPFTISSSRLTSASHHPTPKVNPDLYRMEPRNPFYVPHVKRIIMEIFEKHLAGKYYSAEFCKSVAKNLSDSIKEKVKALDYHRYKIISFVHIGQMCKQGINIASLCLIDETVDNFAEYYYEGSDFFAVGVVYGFYME